MFPLFVSVSVPVCDVTVPLVRISAADPVPVTEKLPPTLDVPIIVIAPELLMNEVPGELVLDVIVVAVTKMGIPDVPIFPLTDVKLTELVFTAGERAPDMSPPILVILTVAPCPPTLPSAVMTPLVP